MSMSGDLGRETGKATVSFLALVLLVVNGIGGIVSGIWLAIVGHWMEIGLGVALAWTMPHGFTMLNEPSFALAKVSTGLFDKGKTFLTFLVGLCGTLYSDALLAAWTLLVFFAFLLEAETGTYIPLLLWGYAAATTPVIYICSKEPPESIASSLGVLEVLVCYGLLTILWFTTGSHVICIAVASGICLLTSLVTVAVGMRVASERRAQHRAFEKLSADLLAGDNSSPFAFLDDDEDHDPTERRED